MIFRLARMLQVICIHFRNRHQNVAHFSIIQTLFHLIRTSFSLNGKLLYLLAFTTQTGTACRSREKPADRNQNLSENNVHAS